MKIGLVSEKSIDKEIEKNLNTIKKYAENLRNKVNLICFGEAFLHGFGALSWEYTLDKEIALSVNSDTINKIKKIAKEQHIAIGFGYFEHDEELEIIYCSYMVIDHMGKCIDNYRRVSIGWKEHTKTDHHYREGERFHIFNYEDKKIVTCLCGDLWYDEYIKQLNELDIDLVIWPLHIDYTIDKWNHEKNEYIMQTKKVDAPIFMINNISKTSYGGCYHFNNGKIIKNLGMGKSGTLIVEY